MQLIKFGAYRQFSVPKPPTSCSCKPLAVIVTKDRVAIKRQKKNEKKSQRFGKNKRGATTPASRHTVAPHLFLPQRTKTVHISTNNFTFDNLSTNKKMEVLRPKDTRGKWIVISAGVAILSRINVKQ